MEMEMTLEGAVKRVLEAADSQPSDFAQLREICCATLGAQSPRRVSLNSSNEQDAADGSRSPERGRFMDITRFSRSFRRDHTSNGTPQWKKAESRQAPITELTVVGSSEAMAETYTKIEKSPSGDRTDVGKSGIVTSMYLCQSKADVGKDPISSIILVFPERDEFVPLGYETLHKNGVPVNMNVRKQGEKIYLCYSRKPFVTISDIVIIFPKKGETLPYGYVKVDRSPNGHLADLAGNTANLEMVLCYKPQVDALEALHQRWLQAALKRDEASSMSDSSPERRDAAPEHHQFSEVNNTLSIETEVDDGPIVNSSDSLKESIERYLYPLLLACYFRHGTVADAAICELTACLEDETFSDFTSRPIFPTITLMTKSVATACHQAVKPRYIGVAVFIRKALSTTDSFLSCSVLQLVLPTVAFVAQYDTEIAYLASTDLASKLLEEHSKLNSPHRLKSLIEAAVPAAEEHLPSKDTGETMDQLWKCFKNAKSIHSSSFLEDVTAILNESSCTLTERKIYLVILALCKSMPKKIVTDDNAIVERQTACTTYALDSLNTFLHLITKDICDLDLFQKMLRRFICTTVVNAALRTSPETFKRMLQLALTLWNNYRKHVKLELALVFEHIILRTLRSSAPSTVGNQLEIMHEVEKLFQLPHNIVELFLNFDMDQVQQWKIFEHLCATLCTITEGISNQPMPVDGNDMDSTECYFASMEAVLAISRSIMDVSGHAHLMNSDARTRQFSMERGGWGQDDDNEAENTLNSDQAVDTGTAECLETPQPSDSTDSVQTSFQRPFESLSVTKRNELQKQNQQLLTRAVDIASTKSLKKSIEYLVAVKFLPEAPRDIASFLRLYHDYFDEVEIGNYLGEDDADFKVQVRLSYVRAISFKGMGLVESLRHFLTNGGFHLPGEAQKIERMVEAFAQCYWEDCPGSFSSSDTPMIMAYSVIMLNTDLHNPQVKKNKMTKDEFIKNNRGIDNGSDLPKQFLEQVYEDIAKTPLQITTASRCAMKLVEPNASISELEDKKFQASLVKAVAQTEELMMDLSGSDYSFEFVGVNACISADLVKLLFERVWFYLLTLSTSILFAAQWDLSMTNRCLDLLRHCISACLFLGMRIERQAFVTLLYKVRKVLDGMLIADGTTEAERTSKSDFDTWMTKLDISTESDALWRVVEEMHLLVQDMKETVRLQQKSEKLEAVRKRINRSHVYLKDTYQFIHEGDLLKKCRSRYQSYRFFLFNDQLLYADKSLSGNWNPHNSLRLKLCRICDVADSTFHKHGFQILNPVKSFIVYADSASAKTEWVRMIQNAIKRASKQINLNARKLSNTTKDTSADAYVRIDDGKDMMEEFDVKDKVEVASNDALESIRSAETTLDV